MTSKLKTDVLETVSGSGTIALTNQLSGMTHESMAVGSVLQVVNGFTTTSVSSTSSTYVDSGLTATITPTSTSSKILVLVSQNGIRKESGNAYIGVRLHRGSTNIGQIILTACYNEVSQTASDACSLSELDSPATTSATTYKTVFNNGASTGTAFINVNPSRSTITLMEIKG